MTIDPRLKKLLTDLSCEDEDLRALSAMTLMKLDFPDPRSREEMLEALMKATGDPNVAVRFFVRKAIDRIKRTESLIKQESESTLAESLEHKLESADFEERLAAVMHISETQDATYKEYLLKMLETEEHAFVKAALVSCLKLFLSVDQAFVFSRFLSDPDSRVRSNTIEALEHLQATDAIPALFSALTDKDNRIRGAAAKALASFGEEKVFFELKKMLNSGEEWMKVSAIYALSHIHASEAVDLLIDTIKANINSDTAIKAIVALANYHDLKAYTFLKGLLSAAVESNVKIAASNALKLNIEKHGEAPPDSMISPLKKAEDEPEVPQTETDTKEKSGKDLSDTINKFFRGGKDQVVNLSEKTSISYSSASVKKEIDLLAKDTGQIVFGYYQAGNISLPDLLTVGHEILRMNFFIQKYTQPKTSKKETKNTGFFEQLKSFFVKTEEKRQTTNHAEKFAKKRDELFVKMGKLALKKFDTEEYQPDGLLAIYQSWKALQKKLPK